MAKDGLVQHHDTVRDEPVCGFDLIRTDANIEGSRDVLNHVLPSLCFEYSRSFKINPVYSCFFFNKNVFGSNTNLIYIHLRKQRDQEPGQGHMGCGLKGLGPRMVT